METLIKSMFGQWTLIKSNDPYTLVHHSDGTKQKFNWRHEAVTHLLNHDYMHDDPSKTDFTHTKDQSKTAKITTHQPAMGLPKAAPTRRKQD